VLCLTHELPAFLISISNDLGTASSLLGVWSTRSAHCDVEVSSCPQKRIYLVSMHSDHQIKKGTRWLHHEGMWPSVPSAPGGGRADSPS